MDNNKTYGFSLVEIILVLGIVSFLFAVCAPHITKLMKGFNNPECSGGYKTVRKVFVDNASFTIPSDASSEIRFTLVGGGGGGADGSILTNDGQVTDTSNCTLPSPSNLSQFYTNVYFNAVQAGASTDCSSSTAGTSGSYINNLLIRAEKSISYSYSISNNSLPWINGIAGMSGSLGNPAFLKGGVPGTYIMNSNLLAGIGQSCTWNNTSYEISTSAGAAACRVTYKKAQAGSGGGAGAYASFTVNNLSGQTCSNITIGQGGTSGQNGTSTSITCKGTTYSVGGGSAASVGSVGSGSVEFNGINFSNAIRIKGNNGSLPDNTTIAGGVGGNVLKNINPDEIFSQGGIGGCTGANTSVDCSNPNGEDGISPSSNLRYAGSGGGGGSCNENGCGLGGKGGNGVVIIEYRAKCY